MNLTVSTFRQDNCPISLFLQLLWWFYLSNVSTDFELIVLWVGARWMAQREFHCSHELRLTLRWTFRDLLWAAFREPGSHNCSGCWNQRHPHVKVETERNYSRYASCLTHLFPLLIFSRGNFGTVRRATHKETGIKYAAKFLRRRRRATCWIKQIQHEIAVLMLSSDSKQIVKLHAVYETRNEFVLILEM